MDFSAIFKELSNKPIDIICHIANLIFIIGSSFKNAFWLRVALVFGSIFEVIYFANVGDKPIWAEIFWIILIAIVNIYMIVITLLEKGFVNLNKDETFIYNKVFSKMDKTLFKKLLNAGYWKILQDKQIIFREQEPTNSLILLCDGEASVIVHNNQVATLYPGSFIGEISFLSGGNATATVMAANQIKLFIWDKKPLTKLLDSNDELNNELKKILSIDLVAKIKNTNIHSEN